MTFEELHSRLPSPKEPPDVLLALDPGETTGYCVFHKLALAEAGQLNTTDIDVGITRLRDTLVRVRPNVIVLENYQVYSWKAKSHSWSSLHTPRLIGALEGYVTFMDPPPPLIKQMAQVAKGFCTDEKLQEWGFYQRGQRHARDSIRHACYYLLWPSQPTIRRT
jgi:hypothetical protein